MNLVKLYDFKKYYLFHYIKNENDICFRKYVYKNNKFINYINYDVPNITTYNPDFNIKVERFNNEDDILHNPYGPAYITYKNNVFCFLDFVYDGAVYTTEVYEWLHKNNIEFIKDMTESDYNRMWFEILD